MPACVVKWCRSHTRIKCPGITFHNFPADPIRQKKWIAAVKLERQENDWMPVKTSRVCSIHFDENDFYESLKGYTMLHKTAVPVCTMVRPKDTSSLRETMENEKIYNNEQLQLKNNIDTECNDGAEEEPRTKLKKNPVSIEVHSYEERGPYVTPINIPSSDIESALDTPETQMLKYKLKKTTILAARRLSRIRTLVRRNKRLSKKNISLKNLLSAILQKILH